jgi:hypothetical protein
METNCTQLMTVSSTSCQTYVQRAWTCLAQAIGDQCAYDALPPTCFFAVEALEDCVDQECSGGGNGGALPCRD